MQPVLRRLQKMLWRLHSDAAADILMIDDKNYRYGHRGYWSASMITSQRLPAVYVHNLQDSTLCPFFWNEELVMLQLLDLTMLNCTWQPAEQVLIIASDIARYGVGSSGESTQEPVPVAMLVSQNPRIFGAWWQRGTNSWCHGLLASTSSTYMFRHPNPLSSTLTVWRQLGLTRRHQADFADFAILSPPSLI